MAPVALVSTFQCYNVHLPKLENLLHRFFDHAQAKIQVTDLQGNYHPRMDGSACHLKRSRLQCGC